MNVNSLTDWIIEARKALTAGNIGKLKELKRISESWMQPEDETEAQVSMIDALIKTLEILEDCDE